MKNTRRLHVRVYVDASYDSELDVPANLNLQDAITYAEEHIDEIPLTTLNYVPDSDEIDPEDRYNSNAFFFLDENAEEPPSLMDEIREDIRATLSQYVDQDIVDKVDKQLFQKKGRD